MAIIFAVHESRPDHAQRIPAHWLDHPTLGRGWQRVENNEVEFDKATFVVETPDHAHTTHPATEADTAKE